MRRTHKLARRRRTPRIPDERYVRAGRLTGIDMPELTHVQRSLR